MPNVDRAGTTNLRRRARRRQCLRPDSIRWSSSVRTRPTGACASTRADLTRPDASSSSTRGKATQSRRDRSSQLSRDCSMSFGRCLARRSAGNGLRRETRGERSTRHRQQPYEGYFDLWALARKAAMNIKQLSRAIAATFARRRPQPLPEAMPLGLTADFARNAQKQTQWKAFVARNRSMRLRSTRDRGIGTLCPGALTHARHEREAPHEQLRLPCGRVSPAVRGSGKRGSAVHSDPRTACFYARRALELAVAWAYKHDAGAASCRTRTTSRR